MEVGPKSELEQQATVPSLSFHTLLYCAAGSWTKGNKRDLILPVVPTTKMQCPPSIHKLLRGQE